jgi:hypothetical protein
MNRNHAFGELAQALSLSRYADNVILALAKIEHGKDLTSTDKEALQFAVEFLKEVHSGSRWLSQEQPVINQESARTMSSFVRAAESLSSGQSLDRLFQNIEELLQSAEAVDAGRAGKPELGLLRRFFGSILNNTLDQVDRSLATSSKLIASV